jgi:hypothetical protein
MIQEIGRLRLVLAFESEGRDYAGIRRVLAEKCWSIARSAMSRGLYCTFATFPGWESGERMMDFEIVRDIFPVTAHGTVCVSVQSSPIDDELAHSILDLLPENLVEQAQGMVAAQTDPWLDVEFRRQVEGTATETAVYTFLRDCFVLEGLGAGLVFYGDVGPTTPLMRVARSDIPTRFMMHVASCGYEGALLVT